MALIRTHAGTAVIAVAALVAALLLGDHPAFALLAGVLVAAFGEAAGWYVRRKTAVVPPAPLPVVKGSYAPLSKREYEVAVRVCSGKTARDVGAEFFIEAKTVENHVSHIYNKLGINTRAELALWLRDRDLI